MRCYEAMGLANDCNLEFQNSYVNLLYYISVSKNNAIYAANKTAEKSMTNIWVNIQILIVISLLNPPLYNDAVFDRNDNVVFSIYNSKRHLHLSQTRIGVV